MGLPQTYLNIVQRWDDGLITDVVQFLRQNWAMAIYYNKFTQFSQQCVPRPGRPFRVRVRVTEPKLRSN